MGGQHVSPHGKKCRATDGNGDDIGRGTGKSHAHDKGCEHDKEHGRQHVPPGPVGDNGGNAKGKAGVSDNGHNHSGSGTGQGNHDHVFTGKT